MPKKIRIELSEQGITEACKKVEQYGKAAKAFPDAYIKALAEEGARYAEEQYGLLAGFSEADGNETPTVRIAKTARGWKIVAEGEDALFIEFGAGDTVENRNVIYSPVPIESDSFSVNYRRKYHRYGKWYYNDELFYYIEPAMVFEQLTRHLEQESQNIARKVWKGLLSNV